MRPVDLLPIALHNFYDQTFDNLTGAPLLIIGDYTWINAPGDAVYTYFRNNMLFGGAATPPKPAQIPAVGVLQTYAPGIPMPAQNLGVNNRDNTNVVMVNAWILMIQVNTAHQRRQRLRVVVPPGEATELVRVWMEAQWNMTPVPVPGLGPNIINAVWNKASYTDTVPGVPAPPGSWYGYRGAIRELEYAVGGYCSYCEAKRQDGQTLDVEHRLAKASYHTEILRWDNFLLGCTICNRIFKNDNPDRVFGITNAINAFHGGAIPYGGGNVSPPIGGPGGPRLPYHEMRQVCDLYHLWPSLDDGGTPNAPIAANAVNPTNYSLRAVRYRMREYNPPGVPGNWVPDSDAVHLSNQHLGDGPGNTIQANVWDSTLATPALRPMYVRVEVEPRALNTGNANFDGRKATAVNHTVAMVGLNAVPNAYGDRRIMQRTIAWFTAITFLGLLRDQLARLTAWQNSWWLTQLLVSRPDVNFTNDLWKLAAMTAEGGYYSVWITVFKQFSQVNNLGNNNLASTLAAWLNARAVANTPYVYKGTHLQNSVLNQIPHL